MPSFSIISRRLRTLFSFLKALNVIRFSCRKSAPLERSESSFGPSPESIKNHEGEVLGSYELISELDRGTFAAVYHCKHTHTHRSYAAKYYSLEWVQTSEFGMDIIDKELHIMKLLKHRNTVFLQDIIFTNQCILVVMELVQGKTLVDILPTKGGLVESFARHIFVQFLNGLEYLHHSRIVHRDIKLENVMIDFEGNVKIIDYGMATHIPRRTYKNQDLMVTERCGSRNYFAPEIYASGESLLRGDLIDIWAAGILLFTLVIGTFPFHDEDDAEKEKKVLNCESWIDNWIKEDRSASPELKDLFRKIFVEHPRSRPSLVVLKDHPWTKGTKLPRTEDQRITFCSSSGNTSVCFCTRKAKRSLSCEFTNFCRSTSKLSIGESGCKGFKTHRSASLPHVFHYGDDANNVAESSETEPPSKSLQGRGQKLWKAIHNILSTPKRIFEKTGSREDNRKKHKRHRNKMYKVIELLNFPQRDIRT